MKIPATWRRVEGAACEPERLEFEVTVTPKQVARLNVRFERMEDAMAEAKFKSVARRPGAVTYMKDGNRRFERCNGEWIERKTIRNPDFVPPPFFQVVYGITSLPKGGCFLCKFPPGMKNKAMLSAITKVANSYGHYARTRGENTFYLEGCDREIWDSSADVPRYEWDGEKLSEINLEEPLVG